MAIHRLSPLVLVALSQITPFGFSSNPGFGARATSSAALHGSLAARSDDTASLQAQIDALPDGGKLTLESRVYVCNGLTVTRGITITGAGSAGTILTRTAEKPVLSFTGPTALVHLRGLTIEGAKLEASGITAINLKELKLDDVHVEHCGVPIGHSIATDHLGKSIDGVYAHNVETAVIDHCVFNSNLRDGFIGIPVKHLFFTNNVSTNNGRMGCTSDRDPSPNGAGGPLSVVYENNQVANCGTGGLHVESIFEYPVVDARFDHNTIRDCGSQDWGYDWGIVMGKNCKGLIRGNTIDGVGASSKLTAYRNGILVGETGGPVTIYQNTVLHAGLAGIAVNDCRYPVEIRDDRIQFSGTHGIAIYRSQVTVSGCTIENSQKHGIWVRLSPGCQFTQNTILHNSAGDPAQFSGIRSELSSGLVITGNEFGKDEQKVGVDLDNPAYAKDWVFSGNTIAGSRQSPRLSSFKSSN